MLLQKVISKKSWGKIFFSCHLEGQWRKCQDPEPDTLARGADPEPYQNVTDPQHCSLAKLLFLLQFLLVHSSSCNMFFRIAKRLSIQGPRFCLFIDIYILEYSWGHFKILLDCKKKSPISIISPICFNLTEGKMANTITHQRTILKLKNKPVEVLG